MGKRVVRSLVFVFFIGLLCLSAFRILEGLAGPGVNARAIEALKTDEEDDGTETAEERDESGRGDARWVAEVPGEEELEDSDVIRKRVRRLKKQNADLVGWIRIPGTRVDLPVMQDPSSSTDFYLNHGFDKNKSAFGMPYIGSGGSVSSEANRIIYSHHMKDGSMFASLDKYKSEDFCEEYDTIFFDTAKKSEKYKLLNVVVVSDRQFPFHEYGNITKKSDFRTYVQSCESFAKYQSGKAAKWGDKLLTLCTCEYSMKNGRLLIIAKKVE